MHQRETPGYVASLGLRWPMNVADAFALVGALILGGVAVALLVSLLP